MCGISGIYEFKKAVDKQQLIHFNQSLTHRGPDFQAVYISPDHKVGLGHCRLSIVDTGSGANQPFKNSDHSLVMSFNGEIYNYIELREELIKLGFVFRTHSDTEVLLYAYQVWGEQCLSKLNGMWAFAIWDATRQQLFLARDRFGVKSLYYRVTESHFAFASEQKAFKAHPHGLAICKSHADRLMMFPEAVESETDTLYQNVSKLRPGEFMYVSPQGIQVTRWWHTYSQIKQSSANAQSAEQLVELFRDACEIRTRTDVKIATTLSGGLDSSSVTSALANIAGIKQHKQLKSFIGSFINSDMDEFHWAKQVVDHYAIDFERVTLNADDAFECIENSTLALEDVNESPVVGQWVLYQTMKQHGYKVSIEGHGGDELLAGYFRHLNVYQGDLLRQKQKPDELARVISAMAALRPTGGNAFVRGSLLQAPQSSADIHHKMGSNKGYLSHLLGASPQQMNNPVEEHSIVEYQHESMLFQKLYEDFHYFTLPYILKNYDRLSMANGVEIRSPFLDYRFVLAAFNADSQFKIHAGQTKALIREHFTFVPETIRQRQDKSGFTHPNQNWFSGKLAYWILALSNESCVTQSSLFDGQKLKQILEQLIATHQTNKVLQYWPLINLALLDRGCR